MMVPSTIAIPETELAVLAGVVHPMWLVVVLAVVVVVAAGLCVAIAVQGEVSVDRAMPAPSASRPGVDVDWLVREGEGVPAA